MERSAEMNKITVVGSINLDTTIRTEQFPKPGKQSIQKKYLLTVEEKERTKQLRQLELVQK